MLFNARATGCTGSELRGNILESAFLSAEDQLLQHVLRPVRRGLLVLVNAEGLLLSFPVCFLQFMYLG